MSLKKSTLANNHFLQGTILVLLSAVCYAILPIFTRQIYRSEPSFDPFDVVFWRFLFAVSSVWLLLILRGEQSRLRKISRQQYGVLLGLGVVFMICASSAALALERVAATTYTLLLYTYPAMVALLALVLGEMLPMFKWVAIGLALIGCTLTISGPIEVKEPIEITFPLLNASAYSIYLILAGRFNRVSGLASGAISMTGTWLAAIPFALLTGLDTPTTTGGWLALIGLGTLSTTLPIVFMLVGILAIGAPNAAILSTIEPIMTVILAAIFLGESLGVMQGIGGAFILASVILLNAPLRRKLTAAIET